MNPDSNVIALYDGEPVRSGEPNQALIGALRALLDMAETGQLQSYIGTGFTGDGLRVATWCDYHQDTYQMLGSLAWLQHEYADRNK